MATQSWFAVIQYAGHGFAGWQRQASARTVQGELEAVLGRLDGEPVTVRAAGRTDAGVHALGQVIGFRTRRGWASDELTRAVNALLPADVWAGRVGPAPEDFHPRRDARARRYRYVVGCDPGSRSPFRHPWEWALGRPLDGAALAAAGDAFRGTHDFRGLSTAGQEKPHYRCHLAEAVWRPRARGRGYIFEVEADRFLHRMVRFLVGVSVDVALGRRPPGDIRHLLQQTDNGDASAPAPPEGLYFVSARYDNLQLEGTTIDAVLPGHG